MKKPVTIENLPLMWANGASFQEVLAAHAHLLAEKLRDHDFGNTRGAEFAFGVADSADLIDPEVAW